MKKTQTFWTYKVILLAVVSFIFGAITYGAIDLIKTDTAVWVGSIGTICTFVFLIAQNSVIQRNQRQQEERIIEHEQKQQEMLVFQKYQLHTQLFYQLLDELETSLKVRFTFTDKERLYREIFPDNSFSQCSYTAQKGIHRLEAKLLKLREYYTQKSFVSDNQWVEMKTALLEVQYYFLGIRYGKASQIGDAHLQANEETLFNLADIDLYLSNLYQIFHRLCHFTSYSNPTLPRGAHMPNELKSLLRSNLFRGHSFLKLKDDDKGRLSLIQKAYSLLLKHSQDNWSSFSQFRIELDRAFISLYSLEQVINDSTLLDKLLEKAEKELQELGCESEECKELGDELFVVRSSLGSITE